MSGTSLIAGQQHESVDNRFTHNLWVNATVVGTLTAGAKTAGALKTLFIARFFGASAELDAYLLAFLLPSFVADVLCGAIVPALVPHFVQLLHQRRTADFRDLYTGALRRSVILLGSVSITLALAAELLRLLRVGSPPVVLAYSLFLIMVPIMPLSAASNVWRAVLNSQERFVLASGASALTPLVMILSLVFAGNKVYWLAAGTTAGTFAEAAVLSLAVRDLNLPLFRRSVQWGTEGSVVMREYRSLALTNLVVGGSVFLDQSMAAWLGSGAVSVLNYGTRLVAVLIAIGPEAVGVTLLPRFSRMMITHAKENAHRHVRNFLMIAMGGGTIVTGVLVYMSVPIVKLAFQHGAFALDDTLAVASVQKLSLLQLPFALGVAFLTRFIVSAKVTRILIPISAASLLLNAGLNIVFMRWYSVAGIALATTVVQALVFALLLIAASRIVRRQEDIAC